MIKIHIQLAALVKTELTGEAMEALKQVYLLFGGGGGGGKLSEYDAP